MKWILCGSSGDFRLGYAVCKETNEIILSDAAHMTGPVNKSTYLLWSSIASGDDPWQQLSKRAFSRWTRDPFLLFFPGVKAIIAGVCELSTLFNPGKSTERLVACI